MSSNNDLKISRSIYKMSIKAYIGSKRTLSDKSLDTYCSVATSLYSAMFPEDTEGLTVEKMEKMNNPALVENILENHETKYKKIAQKKVVLSTLAVIFEVQAFRDMLLKLTREHKAVVDLQVMTPEQEEAWVNSAEMLTLLTKLEKNATAIYKKKDLTPADLQEIQQYIILCLYCGKYIAPRRSQDYFNFKGKDIDKVNDNYFDKDTDEFVFNSFKGRFVNVRDKEGNAKVIEKATQRVPIPPELKKIIAKWFKTTGHDFLLFDIQGKKVNASQLNQRVNKMFGKSKGCGINQMRHTHLTEKYGHLIEDKKELIADMTAMGSSIDVAKFYIQSHNPLEGANGSHPSHHPIPTIVGAVEIETPIVEPQPAKKVIKRRAKKVVVEVNTVPVVIIEDEVLLVANGEAEKLAELIVEVGGLAYEDMKQEVKEKKARKPRTKKAVVLVEEV
jgi:integrase